MRGHRGVNKLTFAGRAKGRILRPGSYLLSLSTRPAAVAVGTDDARQGRLEAPLGPGNGRGPKADVH